MEIPLPDLSLSQPSSSSFIPHSPVVLTPDVQLCERLNTSSTLITALLVS